MVIVILFTCDVLTSCCIVKKLHDAGTTVYTLCTAVISFTKARVKERISYYFGDQLIPEASSLKYLGIIICSYLNWVGRVAQSV
jgi:hypothetical protein